MYAAFKRRSTREKSRHDQHKISTCLYDMVRAVHEAVPGSRDRVVARIGMRMLEDGRARFVGHSWT